MSDFALIFSIAFAIFYAYILKDDEETKDMFDTFFKMFVVLALMTIMVKGV